MSAEALNLQMESDIPAEWEGSVDLDTLRGAARAALRAEGMTGNVGVELLVVDDDEIHRLNRAYRHRDEVTDVLSFPLMTASGDEDGFVVPPEAAKNLGDVVISFPRAQAQAAEYGHSLARELGYLFVHGVLHLVGYDHETESERARMRQKEERALAEVGLTR